MSNKMHKNMRNAKKEKRRDGSDNLKNTNISIDLQRETARIKASGEHIAVVKEPKPVCSICGNTINLISEAIREEDGSFSHFDCVVKKIKEQYHVTDKETVSYIGQGSFAVVATDENGKMYFRERIPYESSETFTNMKKFVEDSKE